MKAIPFTAVLALADVPPAASAEAAGAASR